METGRRSGVMSTAAAPAQSSLAKIAMGKRRRHAIVAAAVRLSITLSHDDRIRIWCHGLPNSWPIDNSLRSMLTSVTNPEIRAQQLWLRENRRGHAQWFLRTNPKAHHCCRVPIQSRKGQGRWPCRHPRSLFCRYPMLAAHRHAELVAFRWKNDS